MLQSEAGELRAILRVGPDAALEELRVLDDQQLRLVDQDLGIDPPENEIVADGVVVGGVEQVE